MRDDHDDFEDLPKSKSQLKREMTALQELGEELVKLSDKDLAKIPMPESLADAVRLARNINSRGGGRRQLQYIGRVMRSIDPKPIQQALESIRLTGQQSAAHFHALERWRDRLLEEGQPALDELVAAYPGADRQLLRQLMLNTAKERKQEKPPKSARRLFQYLRELMEAEE